MRSSKTRVRHRSEIPLLAFALVAFGNTASQAHDFRRLSGAQIRTQFAGNVLTDGTHWRETYAPKGKLLRHYGATTTRLHFLSAISITYERQQ
jgi:hypothetical protein